MEEIPFLSDPDPFTKIKAHHGLIPGLEDRSGFIEVLKIWCVPAFLDCYCYTVLASPDDKEAYLRKLQWRVFSHKPGQPFETALEARIPKEYTEGLFDQLGKIEMKPFETSSDQILDAARIGLDYYRGDVSVQVSWMGGFEGSYKELEKWRGNAIRGFDQYFPKDLGI